jgi:hypothetical protein
MKLTLSGQLKQFLRALQGAFFPTLVLSMIRIEAPIAGWSDGVSWQEEGKAEEGEQPLAAESTRLERQAGMTLEELLADLLRECNAGSKKISKGHVAAWVGYKLHLDMADGKIPIGCILTSASLHDSQAAIPLAGLTAQRIANLYDLMDSAYDAEPLRKYTRSLGHVPIIDANPRPDAARKAAPDSSRGEWHLEDARY